MTLSWTRWRTAKLSRTPKGLRHRSITQPCRLRRTATASLAVARVCCWRAEAGAAPQERHAALKGCATGPFRVVAQGLSPAFRIVVQGFSPAFATSGAGL